MYKKFAAVLLVFFVIFGCTSLDFVVTGRNVFGSRKEKKGSAPAAWNDYGKRLFDIFVTSMALIALSPVFLTIALIIRITSPGPIFYKASRVGQSGKLFKVYKFRSMVVGADKIGPGVTISGDSRVTPIGRFLRRTKMDELPQLLNVLRGEMSLVGPRPEDPRYVQMYTPEQRRVLDVLPGITSPASVHYRNEEAQLSGASWEIQYINEVMPSKLAIDLDYASNPSLQRDLSVLWQTAQAVLTR